MQRRQFTREFKVSVLHELESGKSTAEVCREHNINPTMLYKWKKQYNSNPETAFSSNGNISNLEAKVAQYERIIGQLHIENAFLKKVLSNLETRLQEERKRS